MKSILTKMIFLSSLVCFFRSTEQKMESYIVEGKLADIQKFPHSVFLGVSCQKPAQVENWACGASILNHIVLLTAAHCLEDCMPSSQITALVGAENRNKGRPYFVRSFIVYPDYDEISVQNDLALVALKRPLQFSSRVKRVAIVRQRITDEPAEIAGWGLIDEKARLSTIHLKVATQRVYKDKDCQKYLHDMHRGTICARYWKQRSDGYSAQGDSGSALIVRGYVQIGLVSYKNPSISVSLVVYTDVSYFYDWIKKTSRRLFCN